MTDASPNRFNPAVLLALLAGLLFSVVTPFTRIAIESGASPAAVITLRYVCMILGTAGVILLTHRPWKITLDTGYFAITAAGWLVISIGHLGAVKFIPVSLSAIIFYTFPLMILAWRRVVNGQHFTILQIAAFFVAFTGIAIALGPGTGGLDWRGVALALFGAVGSATFIIGNDALPRENDPFTTTFWLSISNLPFALVWAVGLESWSPPTGNGWLAVLALGFGTVGAMAVLVVAIRGLGAAITGLIMNVEPVCIILLAALLVGEALTVSTVSGMLLVVFALTIAGWPRAHSRT